MNTPFYHREAAAKVRDLSAQFPCVLVTGARQVGKSTMLKAMMPEGMRYITLDDYRIAEQAQSDPIGLLEAYGTPLCIDEIQDAPQLLLPIEVKKSDSPKAADLSAVRSIPTAPTDTVLPGIVLCTAQTAFPLSPTARAFPISAL